MKSSFIKIMGIFLIILLWAMVIFNLIKIDVNILIGSIVCFCLIMVLCYLNYRNILNIKSISFFLLLLGIIIRIILMADFNYHLSSDFELYYNTAFEIANNKTISNAFYLTYNGYVVVFSSVLALLFKLFSSKIIVVVLFNLLCQLGTIYFLYKTIELLNDSYYKYILPSIWFILPTVVEANFLISTETLFIFLFILTIYYYYKICDYSKLDKSSVINYVIFGFLLSFANNIRPIVLIFIIALIIYILLDRIQWVKIVLICISLFSFCFFNIVFQKYCEHIIKNNLQSGALSWAIYYGSNYDYSGSWNLEDGETISEILSKENGSKLLMKESINRYKKMGIHKASLLMIKKYYRLWTDNNANYTFVTDITDYSILNRSKNILEVISFLTVLYMLITTVSKKMNNLYYNKTIIIDIFIIIYVISNMLIVVNGRYNYPIYLLLLLIIGIEKKDGFIKTKLFNHNKKRIISDHI